jgi:hypothetical protein
LRNKCFFVALTVLSVLASGCHTIRPATLAEGVYLDNLPSSSHKVLLVMNENYRTYVSHDRGNDAADPQTYEIGEALTPLTEVFFKRAYPQVETTDRMPRVTDLEKWDFVICPKVEFFNNDLGAISLKQSIQVGLSAEMFDSRFNSLPGISSTGQSDGSIGIAAVMIGSTKKSGRIVSMALQDALAGLIVRAVEATK